MGCGVFFQAEDGIRDLVRSRGLGDVYKRQITDSTFASKLNEIFKGLPDDRFGLTMRFLLFVPDTWQYTHDDVRNRMNTYTYRCLLYTSDAADERSSVDLGGRRIIKKKKNKTK